MTPMPVAPAAPAPTRAPSASSAASDSGGRAFADTLDAAIAAPGEADAPAHTDPSATADASESAADGGHEDAAAAREPLLLTVLAVAVTGSGSVGVSAAGTAGTSTPGVDPAAVVHAATPAGAIGPTGDAAAGSAAATQIAATAAVGAAATDAAGTTAAGTTVAGAQASIAAGAGEASDITVAAATLPQAGAAAPEESAAVPTAAGAAVSQRSDAPAAIGPASVMERDPSASGHALAATADLQAADAGDGTAETPDVSEGVSANHETPSPDVAVGSTGAADPGGDAPDTVPLAMHGTSRGPEVESTESAGRPVPGAPLPERSAADQVAAAVASLRRQGDGSYEASIDLHPAELGRVRVLLQVSGATVDVSVAAEQHSTRSLLSSELDHLRDALSEGGLTAGDLDVRQEGWGSGHDSGEGRGHHGERGGDVADTDAAALARLRLTPHARSTDDRLDLLV